MYKNNNWRGHGFERVLGDTGKVDVRIEEGGNDINTMLTCEILK